MPFQFQCYQVRRMHKIEELRWSFRLAFIRRDAGNRQTARRAYILDPGINIVLNGHLVGMLHGKLKQRTITFVNLHSHPGD
jgi:hypothetical protein